MPPGRDRLKKQILKPPSGAPDEAQQAKVTAVGPPVEVSWQGDTYYFPRVSSYTPVVNDIVAMVRYAGSWLIVGKPTGFP